MSAEKGGQKKQEEKQGKNGGLKREVIKVKDFERISKIFDTRKNQFLEKNHDYGNSWKKTGEIINLIFGGQPILLNSTIKIIAFGVITRMLDKIVRFCNLMFVVKNDLVKEPLADTIGDLGTYAFMLESLVGEKKDES